MTKRLSIIASALLLAALSQPALAAKAPPQQQQEQLQTFKQQLTEAKQREGDIRELLGKMRAETRELRRTVRAAKDDALKQRVEQDLKGFHEKLRETNLLHKQAEDLTKEIGYARSTGDLAKLRTLSRQLLDNKNRQLDKLHAAERELRVVLDRVKSQSR